MTRREPWRTPRRLPRAAPFALLAAAVAAFGVLGARSDDVGAVPAPIRGEGPEADARDASKAPALAALGRETTPWRASGAAPASEAPAAPATPSVPPSSSVVEFAALAPGALEDRVGAGAVAPFPIPRADIVGRVGPFGVRDVAGADRPRWVGVARIERDALAASTAKGDVEAPATTALHGVVVREDGRPVDGAEVIVYSSFYVRQAFYDHRVRQIGRVLTDAEGVFDLRPIALDTVHFGADGEVLVTVRHPVLADWVAQPLPAVVPGQETDVGRLVLPERGASVHGRVLDLEGRPVAGAVVRVSGALDPTAYDKTERMIVLDECPSAVTDADGNYAVGDFAPGAHELSVHVRIDCVVHGSVRLDGDFEWSPRVLAGNSVRGRVVDPGGDPVAGAVVAGGGNWTPTNADGTFWLDNVQTGPLDLAVVHHDWRTETDPDVATNADEITITMRRPLPRVTLGVVDAAGEPVPLVAIDWAWPPGGGPGRFSSESRYYHDARGVFALVVPEGALSATVSDAKGAARTLGAEDLVDGARRTLTLAGPAGGG